MKTRAHLLTVLSLLTGVALFVYFVRQAGLEQLLARVRGIGWEFGLILLVSGLRPVARTYAWLRCMQADERRRVRFFNVWRARVIGDAIGNLTTAGPVAAEPARLLFFGGGLPADVIAASLSAEFLTYVISCCVMMLAGLLILLGQYALSPQLRQISLALLAALSLILLAAALTLRRRWSPAGMAHAALHRFVEHHHFRGWLDRQLRRLLRLEEYLFDFYQQRPRDFLLVSLCEAVFHLLGVIEIYLTLRLIGAPRIGWDIAFIFEAVNRLINIAFAFVPVKVGVDEAGTGLLAEAMGMGTLPGVALAIYRKLRVLFWTAAGLLLLALALVQKGKRNEETHGNQHQPHNGHD
ncbi:MAG: lysylphosphatidylglycerol synthase transmembrane domain-containing protein [Blastocatellia bacterium]